MFFHNNFLLDYVFIISIILVFYSFQNIPATYDKNISCWQTYRFTNYTLDNFPYGYRFRKKIWHSQSVKPAMPVRFPHPKSGR